MLGRSSFFCGIRAPAALTCDFLWGSSTRTVPGLPQGLMTRNGQGEKCVSDGGKNESSKWCALFYLREWIFAEGRERGSGYRWRFF
jgi:hypothetical protein